MPARLCLRAVCLLLLAWSLSAVAEEKLLLEKKSPYNTILVSETESGLRVLRFEPGGARQSVVKLGDPDHLELPYARVLPVGFAFVEQPQRVLVVGLGGGTIPTFLRKHFPELRIDAVDIDPGVVEVAKTHFGFREDARMRAYVEDGRKFIEQRQNAYDIIYLDAFGPDSIPYSLATREFLTGVHRALTPQGVVLGNIWSRYSNPLYDSMVRTYQTVFEEVFIVDVAGVGNKIVVACPRRKQLPIGDLMRRCLVLTRQMELRANLAELIQRGFRVPGEDGVDGRVLTDADPPKDAP